MRTFAAVALVFAVASAQDDAAVVIMDNVAIMDMPTEEDLVLLADADIEDVFKNAEILASLQIEDWEAYLPSDEADVQLVLTNSDLDWLMNVNENAFAFGEDEWSKVNFDAFLVQVDDALKANDMDITAEVRKSACASFEPACDFEFINIGDYIETATSLEAAFMATDWFESAMADPFYELSEEQIAETAEILAANGIDFTVAEITEWQAMSKAEAEEVGITSMDDLTQDNICNIFVEMETIKLEELGVESCADFTNEWAWSMLNAMMMENGMDLAEMGYRSFDDVTEENVFNSYSAMMEEATGKGMDDYGISSFDDFTSAYVIEILEDNGVEVSDEQKDMITENFGEFQKGIAAAQEQVQSTLIAAGLVEDPAMNDGAYTMMASMAAVATAVVALAF